MSDDKSNEQGSEQNGGQMDNAYRVLARKYRPQNFDDLIGQEPMVRTLSNAFKTGRIAQAYMLTGVRGVGKTTTARILARALNYKTDTIDQPTIDIANEGEHCQSIMQGRHVDVIEMDAASHTGIDDIRDIIESVQYAPAIARYKVYIIDEVHMLSRNAFNGLLKTLEEPPSHLKFIFATTEIRKVPITVLSRCQRFDLRRIDTGTMATHLNKIAKLENVQVQEDAIAMLTRASEGSVRDALSMFDQAIAHSDGNVIAENVRSMLGLADRSRVIDLFENVMSGEIAKALAEIQSQYEIGADPYVVLTDLADFIHYVTRLKYTTTNTSDGVLADVGSFSETERERGRAFADKLSVQILGRAWQILLKGLNEVQTSERALAAAEMVLVRLTHAADLPSYEKLVQEVRSLEQNTSTASPSNASPKGGAPAMPSSGGDASSTRHMPSTSPVKFAPQAAAANDSVPISAPANYELGATSDEVLAPALQPKTEEAEKPKRVVNTFDELLFLAEDRRDLKAKTFLKRNIRLVECKNGYLEYNLVGNPPREATQHFAKKIEEWTGTRWALVISQKDGLPTIEEIERAELNQKLEDARSHPAVAAIMKAFDGARIVDVRIRAEQEALPPAPEEDDDDDLNASNTSGSGDANLDDFFE
ncbi:MAG: DNA polymerase III subunit gamma/tau [Nitratireductor sp.]